MYTIVRGWFFAVRVKESSISENKPSGALLLVVDLDRPNEGFLHLSQPPAEDRLPKNESTALHPICI